MSDAAQAKAEAFIQWAGSRDDEGNVYRLAELLDAFAAEQTARAEAAEAQVERLRAWVQYVIDEAERPPHVGLVNLSADHRIEMKALLADPVPPSGEPR